MILPRPHLLLLPAGFVIWSSSFVTLYWLASIGCGQGWQDTGLGPFSMQRLVLLAVWIAHLAALAGVGLLIVRAHPTGRPETFLRLASLGTLAAATVATIWTALPVLLGVTCSG